MQERGAVDDVLIIFTETTNTTPASLVSAFGVLDQQVKPRVLGICFRAEPIRAQPTATTDSAPFAHQRPFAKKPPHDVHAVETVLVGLRLGLCQIHLASVLVRETAGRETQSARVI